MTSRSGGKNKSGFFEKQAYRRRESAPKVARAVMVMLSAFLVFAVVWAAKTEMRELVRAEGEIAPDGELRSVDHFDGGMVSKLFVAAGAEVSADDPLALMENPGLDDQIAEIEAELAAVSKDIFNTTWLLDGKAEGAVSPSIQAQRRLFIAQQEMMENRIDWFAEATDAAVALRDNAEEYLSLSEKSLRRLQSLYERGVVSEAKLLVQAEEAARIRAEFLQTETTLSEAKTDALEAVAVKKEAYLAFQEKYLEALSELERSRHLLQVRLEGLYSQKERQTVRAPESGVIQSSNLTTIGQSVPPGGLMFELLPSGERLVAVVKVDPKDVGHIREGSKTALKLSTFDARRFGEVQGRIELVSPTSILPDQGEAFYRVTVSLDRDTIGAGANERRLRAGMTLVAEIETDKRSVLSYLLKPVQRAFDQALTER